MTTNSSQLSFMYVQKTLILYVLRQYHEAPASLKEKLNKARNCLSRGLWLLATLGICHIFYKTWRFVPGAHTCRSKGIPFFVTTNDGPAKWKAVVKKLKKEWKQIYLGCALILSISVALLQIDLVLQSNIGRTTAIMAFIFSGAGLTVSTTFMLVIDQSKNRTYPTWWIEASEASDNLRSIKFWSLLALPLSLLVWSIIFCIITVLNLSWSLTTQNGGAGCGSTATRLENIVSVVFIINLALMVTGQVYLSLKFARELR